VGVVYKVQTLVDGGIRITLDLPEQAIPQAAMLMECKRQEIPLRFEARASEQAIDGDDWKADLKELKDIYA
jgi:hypothetical protein